MTYPNFFKGVEPDILFSRNSLNSLTLRTKFLKSVVIDRCYARNEVMERDDQ